eukprot:7383942-Prymnesium_polylepis.2
MRPPSAWPHENQRRRPRSRSLACPGRVLGGLVRLGRAAAQLRLGTDANAVAAVDAHDTAHVVPSWRVVILDPGGGARICARAAVAARRAYEDFGSGVLPNKARHGSTGECAC